MAQVSMTSPNDKRDREIILNGKPIKIEFKGSRWVIKKPLKVENGIAKKVAGVEQLAVKPKDKTWKKFKNAPADIKFDIGKPDDNGNSLDKLIKRIVELKKKGWENVDFERKNLFKDADNIKKYLIVAEWVGLWGYDAEQTAKEDTQRESHYQKGRPDPLSDKIDARFNNDQYIQRWLRKFTDNDTKQYKKTMFNVLKILDFTPEELAYMDYKGDDDDLEEAIEERIFPLREWAANPYNRYPTNPTQPRDLLVANRFVKGTKKTFQLPDDIRRLPTDTGWEKLIETKGKHKGKIEVGDRNNNIMYGFAKVIRNFLNANKRWTRKRVPETHILSQEAPSVAQYGDVKLSWNQIQGMQRCLLDGIKDNTKKVRLTRKGKTFSPFKDKKGSIRKKAGWQNVDNLYGEYNLEKYSDKWSAKSYWEDAYFFFMLGLEMGYRAEEGFDIIAEPPIDDESSGVEIIEDGNKKIYFVSLYTRKTEMHKEGRIHRGLIPDSPDGRIVIGLINKRLADIKKHIGIDRESPYHALIGQDNKYTKISTIALPTDQVTIFGKRREIIKNILRHCYEQVEAKSAFYYERPLHAVRHVFAQYWLNKSGYNYTFVMRLGHWSTLATLLKSYGKMGDEVYAVDHNLFANIDASKPFAIRRKQIADAQKEIILEEPEPYVPTAKPKDKKPKNPIVAHFETEQQVQQEPTIEGDILPEPEPIQQEQA